MQSEYLKNMLLEMKILKFNKRGRAWEKFNKRPPAIY